MRTRPRYSTSFYTQEVAKHYIDAEAEGPDRVPISNEDHFAAVIEYVREEHSRVRHCYKAGCSAALQCCGTVPGAQCCGCWVAVLGAQCWGRSAGGAVLRLLGCSAAAAVLGAQCCGRSAQCWGPVQGYSTVLGNRAGVAVPGHSAEAVPGYRTG